MAFERIAEQRLRQAIEAGEFDDLPNAGKPIDLDEYFAWPEAMRVTYSVLKNANCVPIEVELLKDIAQLEASMSAAADAAVVSLLRRRLGARRIELAVKLERARTRR